MHRLTATDTPMVRYTRTIFPSYAFGEEDHSNLSGCATTNSLDTGEMSVEQKRINNA